VKQFSLWQKSKTLVAGGNIPYHVDRELDNWGGNMPSEMDLYFIWEMLPLARPLFTSKGSLQIFDRGLLSFAAGPDFQGVALQLGHTGLQGDVEFHVRSGDWYRHGHHRDHGYDKVILHLVWETENKAIRTSANNLIPEIELGDLLPGDRAPVTDPPMNWENLFRLRLRRKIAYVISLRETFDAESTCWILLARALGYSRNAETMEAFARIYTPAVIRRLIRWPAEAERILQQAAFTTTKGKQNMGLPIMDFIWKRGGRPATHPKERLRYLAALIKKYWQGNLWLHLREATSARTDSNEVRKKLGQVLHCEGVPANPGVACQRLFLSNGLLPLLFAEHLQNPGYRQYLYNLYFDMPAEAWTKSYKAANIHVGNVAESQGLREWLEQQRRAPFLWLAEEQKEYTADSSRIAIDLPG
jgi:hypothetical protein